MCLVCLWSPFIRQKHCLTLTNAQTYSQKEKWLSVWHKVLLQYTTACVSASHFPRCGANCVACHLCNLTFDWLLTPDSVSHLWSFYIDLIMLETRAMLNPSSFLIRVLNMRHTVWQTGACLPKPVSHPPLGT